MPATVEKLNSEFCIYAKKYVNDMFYIASSKNKSCFYEVRALKWILESGCDYDKKIERRLEHYGL